MIRRWMLECDKISKCYITLDECWMTHYSCHICHMAQFCKNNIIIFDFIQDNMLNFMLSCNWWLSRVKDVECNSKYFNYK